MCTFAQHFFIRRDKIVKHEWKDTRLASFIRTMPPLRIVVSALFVAALMIPIELSDSHNRDRQTTFALGVAIVPEKFGYFGGLVHFDTLEIRPQGVLIQKHGLFRNKAWRLPYRQISKIVFGVFLGQRYIKLDFYEGWIRSSFRIYINRRDANNSLTSLFDGTGVETDNRWNIKEQSREDSIRIISHPLRAREGYR
ncbi:MAG: hypothetical protein NTV54_12350 [Ignavibacteriales bacterium]|nr:hypothetical protein [Ignavibacteriales bacterium]